MFIHYIPQVPQVCKLNIPDNIQTPGNCKTLFNTIECGLTKQFSLYCFQFLCADTRQFRHSGVQRKESLAE